MLYSLMKFAQLQSNSVIIAISLNTPLPSVHNALVHSGPSLIVLELKLVL